MKKALSVVLIILCVGVFAFGDAYAAQPKGDKGEKINGVSRMTHSGDIKGTFTLPTGTTCIAATDPLQLQVLVYIPGISIMARPMDDGEGNYSFTLYNVPAHLVDVVVEVQDVAASTLTTITMTPEPVSVQKQRVLDLGTVALSCPDL